MGTVDEENDDTDMPQQEMERNMKSVEKLIYQILSTYKDMFCSVTLSASLISEFSRDEGAALISILIMA